ncbi:heparan sulfate glucosamine 3-O-sulfotransferase 6-like [Haemaphysalis longicornis]
MSSARKTSLRRLVAYTAALCMLIGYAFFAQDLTPTSGYNGPSPVQPVDDGQEPATSASVTTAQPASDVAINSVRLPRQARSERPHMGDVLVDKEGTFRLLSEVDERRLRALRMRRRSGHSRRTLNGGRLGPLALALRAAPSPRLQVAAFGTPEASPVVGDGSDDEYDRPEKPANASPSANEVDIRDRNDLDDGETDSSGEGGTRILDGYYDGAVSRVIAGDAGVPSSQSAGALANYSVVDATFGERPRRRLPQAIIIGVKKGGTRAVLEYLRLHPQVRAAGPEPHFFDKHYHRGFVWYRSQMPESVRGQVTMEKTPSYLVRDGVPGRVRAMSSRVKLVLVLRDPTTRAVSDYAQASAKGRARRSFLHSVTDSRTGAVDRSKPLVRVGLYDEHVSRWLAHFPRSSFHFVSGERLVAQPERELASLQRFLGLPKPWVGAAQLVFNSTKGFPCLLREPGAAPHCLDPSKGRPHPRLDEDLERRLRQFYAPHNRRLYRIIGRDLGWPP